MVLKQWIIDPDLKAIHNLQSAGAVRRQSAVSSFANFFISAKSTIRCFRADTGENPS